MKKIVVFLILILVSLAFNSKKKKTPTEIYLDNTQKVKESIQKRNNEVFEEWFKLVKKWEGGIGDRPKEADAAGLTNHGVTIWYWKTIAHKVVGKKPTNEALKTLTWTETKKIAKHFWKSNKIDNIKNPELRIIVAEAFWGSGNVNGIRSLGYKSINSINKDTNVTVKYLYNQRLSWLQRLKNWEHNKSGWSKRLKNDLTSSNKFKKV